MLATNYRKQIPFRNKFYFNQQVAPKNPILKPSRSLKTHTIVNPDSIHYDQQVTKKPNATQEQQGMEEPDATHDQQGME